MYFLHHYVIDYDKINTVEDIKRILQALEIAFEQGNKGVQSIKDLVVLVDKQTGEPLVFQPKSKLEESK